MIVRTTEG